MFALITGSSPNSSRLPQPLFKRVVIMLVDALREDFVFGPSGRMYMPYTRHLVERGSSNSFVAKARPPTVTMPRIKVRCYHVTQVWRYADLNENSPIKVSTMWHPTHGISLFRITCFWLAGYGKLKINLLQLSQPCRSKWSLMYVSKTKALWNCILLQYASLNHDFHAKPDYADKPQKQPPL